MSKNEDFMFLKNLNHDLYKRYLMIEDALRNTNGYVYVEMQAFLEHLFKYISNRENFSLHQTTLGDCLKNNNIIKFCLVRIEYDHLECLKLINSYGNHYKHKKVIDFNFDEFIKCMKEVYMVSRKVYNYYNKKMINQIKMFDKNYYFELIVEEQNKIDKHLLYQANLEKLSQTLIEKKEEISKLKELLNEYLSKIKLFEKNTYTLEVLSKQLKKDKDQTKVRLNKIQIENRLLKKELKELKDVNRHLINDNNELRNYKIATEGMISSMLRHNENEVIDDMIKEIKSQFVKP